MIKVLETVKLNTNATILVCDMFDDKIATKTIKSNIGLHSSFAIETPQECFSKPKTRDVLVYGGDFSKIKEIEFV